MLSPPTRVRQPKLLISSPFDSLLKLHPTSTRFSPCSYQHPGPTQHSLPPDVPNWHYVSGLVSLPCTRAARGSSLMWTESSHVVLTVCGMSPHLHTASLPLAGPLNQPSLWPCRHAALLSFLPFVRLFPALGPLQTFFCLPGMLFNLFHKTWRSVISCVPICVCGHIPMDAREVCVPRGNGENCTSLGKTGFEHEWTQCLTCSPQDLASYLLCLCCPLRSHQSGARLLLWSKRVASLGHRLLSTSSRRGRRFPS